VTSECGTVVAVDVERRELAATMDDGRLQRFGPEEVDAEHLAHAYAITVHRSQGSTVGRAHVLEDGGGRELAYVKMSRARERSMLYVVGDSPEQAAEDLCRSWRESRRIGWAIDRGTPAPGLGPEPGSDAPAVAAALRHARLVAERAAIAAVIPTDVGDAAHRRTRNDAEPVKRQWRDLDRAESWGEWRGTPGGKTAKDWRSVVRDWHGSQAQARHAALRERERLRQQAARAAEREGPPRERFALAGPEAQGQLDDLRGRQGAHRQFRLAHPEALRRLELLDDQIATAAWELDIERQGLDGIAPQPPSHHARERGFGRDVPVLDRGMDLGIGL